MNIVFLTGAGISVASGLRPFRGANGLYNGPEADRLSKWDAVEREPDAFWRFWGAMRAAAITAQPNAAHVAIAEMEQRLGDRGKVTVITMNVDGLHQRARGRKRSSSTRRSRWDCATSARA